jgi:hypothetical protein
MQATGGAQAAVGELGQETPGAHLEVALGVGEVIAWLR